MTFTSDDRRNLITATTGQLTYTYDFPIDNSTEITVKLSTATGELRTLSEGSTIDYTVTGAGTTGGTVVLSTHGTTDSSQVTTAHRLSIQGNTGLGRAADYSTGGDFLATTVNTEEDRQHWLIAELRRDLDRALVIEEQVDETAVGLTVPENVDGKVLGWSGTTLANLSLSTGTVLSNTTPQAVGTAAAGTAAAVSRDDHVHAIGALAINSSNIADGTINSTDIKALAVGTTELGVGAVLSSKVAAGAILSSHLKAAFIADFSTASLATGDLIHFGDVNDSNNSKRATAQEIADLAASGPTLGTEQASTSGSAITFGSIPAGTKTITVMFNGVSTDGTASLTMTLGDAGGLETSGYLGTQVDNINSSLTDLTFTASFELIRLMVLEDSYHGSLTLHLEDAAGFTWVMRSGLADKTDAVHTSYGSKSLSAELTQLSISCASDAFDLGAINIQYQ